MSGTNTTRSTVNLTKTKEQFRIWIPGNVPSSKNSKVWTGKWLIDSKATRRYKRDTKKFWLRNHLRFKELIGSRPAPYKIEFTFVRGTKHKFDYVNPLQTIQDLMVEHKWIPDDNMTILLPSFGEHQYDKDKPGVWIEVL